jgi:putative Ca2+/H+ antiporter (TMEM165/GDT1 family)
LTDHLEALLVSTGVVALAEIGDKLADRIPMKLVHSIAAATFALLGVATLLGAGSGLGF